MVFRTVMMLEGMMSGMVMTTRDFNITPRQ
jgi:hypothetical protein